MRVFLELRPGSEPSFCNPDQRWPVDIFGPYQESIRDARASENLLRKTNKMSLDNASAPLSVRAIPGFRLSSYRIQPSLLLRATGDAFADPLFRSSPESSR